MKYDRIEKAVFLSRPNRFIANVKTEKGEEVCHVKNTGRCRELLIPGAEIYVQRNDSPLRKTALDLIGVRKGELLINMDSQIPNRAAEEWLKKGNLFTANANIKPETKYGNSRFDLYVEEGERRAFIEVKGVTLEEDGTARFPDAPTIRGLKHVDELVRCQEDGYEAYILFVIQMKGVHSFEPNNRTQPEFGTALKRAEEAGVKILAYDCIVTTDSIEIDRRIPVHLD